MIQTRYSSGTLLLSCALAVRALAQLAIFFLAANVLGVETYGVLITLVAMGSIVAPVTSLGLEYIVLRQASLNTESTGTMIAVAISLAIGAGVSVSIVLTIIVFLFLSIDVSIAICLFIFLTEIVGNRIQETCARYYQGKENTKLYAMVRVGFPTARLLVLIIIGSTFDLDLLLWVIVTSIASTVTALCFVCHIAVKETGFKFSTDRIGKHLVMGMRFMWGGVMYRLGNDGDKILVEEFSGLEAAGTYGAGYKIIETTNLLAQSLISVNTSKFYRAFSCNFLSGWSVLINTLAWSIGINVILAVLILLSGSFVSQLLGDGFVGVERVMQILAVYPLLLSIRSVGSLGLQACGFPNINSKILFASAIFCVVGAVILVPEYGWRGAAYSSIASEFFSILFVYIYLFKLGRAASV